MTTEEKIREYIKNDIKDTIGFYEAWEKGFYYDPSKYLCFFPQVSKVIYHDPATIVFWNDGTKTVVKCSKDDVYNPVTGLAVCFVKKFLGPLYLQEFKKNLPKMPKTTETKIYTEDRPDERCNVFAEQCPKCAWYTCMRSCSKCGAQTELGVPLVSCACCLHPDPDETSCKYYKRKED